MTAPNISVVLPLLVPTQFLRAMTEFSIKTLRMHADNPFELVVVEAVDDYFRHLSIEGSDEHDGMVNVPFDPLLRIDRYIRFPQKIGNVREANAGIDAATGEFILCTGNDVIAPPHWDTELLRPFERKDCGASALAAFEPGAIIGPPGALAEPAYVEGMYSPFTMFRRGWRLDEAYRKIYQDSDFIMRLYEAGLRSYRSCRAHVHHLLRMTSDRVEPEEHARQLAVDERLFYARWGKSPLWMFGMIRGGGIAFGREHEPFVRPINLHYDPSKAGG